MVGLFYLARLFRYKNLQSIPRAFHRGVCKVFSVHVKQYGELCRHQPMLYVGNHISYLDIFVLGGVIPGYFIAKSDVAGWPLLGRMARLQNTLFFERNARRAAVQIDIMRNHLQAGGNLILFPEGTSTYGTSVVPFKSSLFKAAEHDSADVLVQPFAISYTRCAGKPMSAEHRDNFAWYDEMAFFKHFIRALGNPRSVAEVHYSTPVRVSDFASRKDCAQHCWEESSRLLRESLQQGQELTQNQ